MRACTLGAVPKSASVCARECISVRALSVGVDGVRFGSQAFSSAKAFNADIGAWNTARITNLYGVCAAFGRRRAPRRTRSAGVRFGAAVVRGGTADARAHECARTHL
jgi:hypothetical protein